MIKRVAKLMLVIVPLMFFSFCQRESEAQIRIVNIGNVDIGIKLHYYDYRINAGQEDTLTLTWPGRGEMALNLFVYAIEYTDLFDNYQLILNHKDYIVKEVGYTVQK